MEAPLEELIVVKVVDHGLLVRDLYATDNAGNVWKCTEGMGKLDWKLFKRFEEL
jgi:hypothetical protein